MSISQTLECVTYVFQTIGGMNGNVDWHTCQGFHVEQQTVHPYWNNKCKQVSGIVKTNRTISLGHNRLDVLYLSPPRINAVLRPVYLPSWKMKNRNYHWYVSLKCSQTETEPEELYKRQWHQSQERHNTSRVNFMVWSANSLVGVRISALAPVWAWGAFSFSNIGIKKAAVFPLPVLAMATTSFPSRMTGTVCQGDNETVPL